MPSISHTADVVIVGAGSAGCTLASRLSENPYLEVLLLEAGERQRNWWIDIPTGYVKTVGDPRHDWKFVTEPDMSDRRFSWPRGKGPGGTSLINGMLYLRGHRKDYDGWADLGCRGWDWASIRPYFDRSLATATNDASGDIGTFRTSSPPPDTLSDAFIEAAEKCQIPHVPDFNGGDNFGAGYFKLNTYCGQRWSTARAFLEPALDRSNLKILTNAHCTRLMLERNRVVGVEAIRGGKCESYRARHEVIVCAGAVQSPQLLQLSGIGNPDLLRRHGIRIATPLNGVGRNLQDHLQIRPTFRMKGVETLNEVANSRWRQAQEMAKYLLTRRGALSWGVFRAGAFFSSGTDQTWPDAQIHFGLLSFDERHQPLHPFPGVTISACALRPLSRGRVEIASADPVASPAIFPGYLTEREDCDQAIAMFRKVRQIAATRPLVDFVDREHEPGDAVQSDDEILDWVRRRASSIFHPVGTCAMGPDSDPNSVLDEILRVRGVDGLRVADGSVMPRIVSGNTNAPIIMIAERAADLVRAALTAHPVSDR